MTDLDQKRAVLREFQQGPRLDMVRTVRHTLDGTFAASDASCIAASVFGGWVTLAGQLDGWTKRVRAAGCCCT